MTNKKRGIIFLSIPGILFFGSLIGYAVFTFLVNRSLGQQPVSPDGLLMPSSPFITQLRLARVVLGLLGVLGVFSAFILVPFGIYFMAKSEEKKNETVNS